MRFALTVVSRNRKTGPIPVSTSSADTCPPSCAQFAACYAKQGRTAMHWEALNRGKRKHQGDDSWLAAQIRALPEGQLWRHNEAGDLPGCGETVDVTAMVRLVDANKGRRGFTYTHKNPDRPEVRAAVQFANNNGFTVNLSADGLKDADRKASLGIAPVVTVVDAGEARETFRTPGGRRVTVCPAVTRDGVTCQTCGLCQVSGRKSIVAFPAHGTNKGKAVLS